MIGTFVYVQYERNAVVIYGLFIQSQCFNLAGSQLRASAARLVCSLIHLVIGFNLFLFVVVSDFHADMLFARRAADISSIASPT
jgi:hypothetical protein